MVTDYPHNNSAERKGGGGAQTGLWVWPGLLNVKSPQSCSLVAEDKTLLCPLPIQNKKIGNLGWVGALIPRLWGRSVCLPSSILLMLPLQIPCSLVVAKLMSNSCAPLPRPDSEKLKESPVPRMLPHWGLCYWVGVNEKVQNTGILCPIFLRCGLYYFLAFIFFFKF